MRIVEELDAPTFRASKMDKKIMAYLREHLADAATQTISEVAQGSGAAEATCTRFVRKLGFAAFSDFKTALAKEAMEIRRHKLLTGSVENGEPVRETARKLLSSNMRALESTYDALLEEAVGQCAKRLLGARRIIFIGLGYSGIIAQDSNFKFMRIGMNTSAVSDSHTMVMMASILGEEDVLFAISHSGETEEIIRAVTLAKKNGVEIISLTESHPSQLQELSDITLGYVSNETQLESGSISSKMAQFFLIDLVYTQMVKLQPEATAKRLQTTKALEAIHRHGVKK